MAPKRHALKAASESVGPLQCFNLTRYYARATFALQYPRALKHSSAATFRAHLALPIPRAEALGYDVKPLLVKIPQTPGLSC